ncbi:MAG: hypothetical protein GX250_02660 [Clostridiales bacterium]|nr:hypothetical protein [Clostridiales bacterium]
MEGCCFEYINKTLAFYKNTLSVGFENDFFKEGNSEEMILRRLERAAKDEACGDLLHSRYAIWASDLINVINAAKDAISRNDNSKALYQLELASNAIKAYKDIMTLFDGKHYQIGDVFSRYATHLLKADAQNSYIIGKDEIIKRLKEKSRVSGADLPREIDFTIKNRVLQVFIKNAAQDMQNDSVAFEGWVLILKHWLSAEIEYVMLDFEPREDLMHKYGFPEACHYNRFLYRLYSMSKIFPDWFFIKESKRDIVFDFINWIKSNKLVLNHSLREREDVIETTKMERQIESWFVFHEGKELLSKRWNIDENKLYNQLPMGVFIEKITKNNAVFSRGASAIDMWGVDKDGQTLHLIELKCGENKGLGVIGETLFYTALIYDTCVSDDSLFSFGKYGTAPDTSDAAAIKNNGRKFSRLMTHILAEKNHPLFSDGVVGLIREGLKNLDIGFDRATYSYLRKDFVDADNDL